jgi:hypothetical protein
LEIDFAVSRVFMRVRCTAIPGPYKIHAQTIQFSTPEQQDDDNHDKDEAD